jgi:hypothetical protein
MRRVNFMAIWKVDWKEFRTNLEKGVERTALSICDNIVTLQTRWVSVDTIILQFGARDASNLRVVVPDCLRKAHPEEA